jgi:hypothetical protein
MNHATQSRDHWRVCSICKGPIQFRARYQRCSVSTCNRKRTQLIFCSVRCWEAHVPTLRHRDAWAVEETAPSHQDRVDESHATAPAAPAAPAAPSASSVLTAVSAPRSVEPTRRVVAPPGGGGPPLNDDVDQDILIVASKLKKYIKARSGMRTSDEVMPLLSDLVRAACDEAIGRARESERSTVLDRDIPGS